MAFGKRSFKGRPSKRNNPARALRRATIKQELDSRTPEELDEAMVKAIIDCAINRGGVQIADLRRAGIPASVIEARFKLCLAIARERAPEIDQVFQPA